jgi:hypothetical protein
MVKYIDNTLQITFNNSYSANEMHHALMTTVVNVIKSQNLEDKASPEDNKEKNYWLMVLLEEMLPTEEQLINGILQDKSDTSK